jgi:NAD(P)H-dependent FMN reductase
MPHIVIISASVRTGRASHRVALFFEKFLYENNGFTAEIADLATYHFPLFEERLSHQSNPPSNVLSFAEKIKKADGVIIVTPEYNGGYPASLKNIVDLLYNEWYRKPIAICTVSSGAFAGTQVITSLQFTLWKIRAWVVPAMFPVPQVAETFNEQGEPNDKATIHKRADIFIKELVWCIEAKRRMSE